MGASKSTYNIQVKKLTGDGSTGYWWFASKPSDGTIYQMDYADKDQVIEKSEKLSWEETFYEGVDNLRIGGDVLPVVDQGVNVDFDGPESHFLDPLLTNGELDNIAGWYDPKDFCEKMGARILVKRFFDQNYLDWSGGASNADDIYIYLGQKNKATKDKIVSEMDLLLYEGGITQPQYEAFWVRWTNEV